MRLSGVAMIRNLCQQIYLSTGNVFQSIVKTPVGQIYEIGVINGPHSVYAQATFINNILEFESSKVFKVRPCSCIGRSLFSMRLSMVRKGYIIKIATY